MIVIADTSPLHYLILLKHAEILLHLYGCVMIPEAVARELQAPKTPSTAPVDRKSTGVAASAAN